MKIGIPKERKVMEGRVALVPFACSELIQAGHEVAVETEAGVLSGYPDAAYADLGVKILPDPAALYDFAELVVKVKEPVGEELDLLQERHILFSYLHLAANRVLAEKLKQIGLHAIAFETVSKDGGLPLLAPMSQIAGRVSAQVGTTLLHQSHGGRGVLLGGVAGAPRGETVVLGAGIAGGESIATLARLGANVTVFDKNTQKLDKIRHLGDNVTALYPYQDAIAEALEHADLVIGAVLLPGARAPVVVSREQVRAMPEGSVIIDISVDQGGCVETTRATDYANPVYREEGVVHFAVTNIPGAVPRSASQALSAVLLPYVITITQNTWQNTPELQTGLNVSRGEYTHPAIREAFA